MILESKSLQQSKMLPSDEKLMLSYRNGKKEAFEILYRRYEMPIFSFIYRIVMSTAKAEDLCQETFFRVVKAKKKYQASGKFKTWLFRIAHNLCRDRLRRMKFRKHLSLDDHVFSQDCDKIEIKNSISDPSPDQIKRVETDEMKNLVQRAFTTLPEEQRMVVILKEYHTLKFSEIAEIMDCPIGTVKSHNHRAHEKLKKILAPYIDKM
jgi:RNA polymerase sigma-70 factor (ECF subfamily)